MKTTTEGSPYLPLDPVVPRVTPSPLTEDKLHAPEITEIPFVVSEPKGLSRSDSSIFEDFATQLESPSDMIDFHSLLAKFNSDCSEISDKGSYSSSDAKVLPRMITLLLKVIEAIPTDDLVNLITGFQNLTSTMHSKPSTPSLARLKSPKPIINIPIVKGQEKKGPKLITPRIIQPKAVNTHQPLAPLADLNHPQDSESILNLINFVIAKASYLYTASISAKDNRIIEQIVNFCVNVLPPQNHISTRIYAAAVLSNISKDSKLSQIFINSPNWSQAVTQCFNTELEINDSVNQFLLYMISFLNYISNNNSSESQLPKANIIVLIIKILRDYTKNSNIVLQCLSFLEKCCDDAVSRSTAITEYSPEDLIEIFLTALNNHKINETIVTRIAYIFSVFMDKEFDFANAITTVSSPFTISLVFDVLKQSASAKCVESLTALISCLISIKQCLQIVIKNVSSLLQTSKPFMAVTSAMIILETLRQLARATPVDTATILKPLEDWLATGDSEVIRLALSLCYDLSENGMPLEYAHIVLPFVGDERMDLSFLAIRAIAAAAKDPMIESLGEKIDSRVKRVIGHEELDQGTVAELGKLFENLPQGILSDETLDDARAFDDLAIYTC